MNLQGSYSQGNIIFQDFSRTKLPFSRTNIEVSSGLNQDSCEKA
jgi:hypothetical protein